MDEIGECQTAYKWFISFTIHETRDLKYVSHDITETLPNQWHEIRVGTQLRQTPVRPATAGSAFDYRSTLSINATLQDLGYQLLELTSYHQFRVTSAVIGVAALCLRTIWNRPEHQLAPTWLPLTRTEDPTTEVGCVEISIRIECASSLSNDFTDNSSAIATSSATEIEASELRYYALQVCIHKGEDIRCRGILSQGNNEPNIEVLHCTGRMRTKVVALNANPDWNTQITLSTSQPSMDEYLRISLWSGLQPATRQICATRLLSLRNYMDQSSTPKLQWLNFYTNDMRYVLPDWQDLRALAQGAVASFAGEESRVTSGWDATPRQLVAPATYTGRVLVSISSRPIHDPIKTSLTLCGMTQPPPSSPCDLYVQVFEVASTLKDVGPVKVEIEAGPLHASSESIVYQDGRYRFQSEAKKGILSPFRLMISDLSAAYFVTVFVQSRRTIDLLPSLASNLLTDVTKAVSGNEFQDDTDLQRVAYTHVTLPQIASWESKPVWLKLRTVDTQVEVFKVLIRFVLQRVQDSPTGSLNLHLDRAYETRPYIFRCFLYEAVNIRSPSSTEFPSPYIKCELGSCAFTTNEVIHCIHPLFFQAYEQRTNLPDNISLAEPITVSLYHKATNSLLTTDEFLGGAQYDLQKVPKEWRSFPEWINLTTENQKGSNCGHVLCSFELIEEGEADQYPFYQDVRPSTRPSTVTISILGLSSGWVLTNPRVKISYGRDLHDSKTPLWSAFSSSGQGSQGSTFTYNQNMQVALELPKRYIYYAYLEIEVYSDNYYDAPILTGIIPLSELVPWYKPYEMEVVQDLFALSLAGEDKARGSRRLAGSDAADPHDDLNCSTRSEFLYVASNAVEEKLLNPPGRELGNEAVFYLPTQTKETEFTERSVHNVPIDKLMFNLQVDDDNGLTEDERRETIVGPIESILCMNALPYKRAALVTPVANDHPAVVGQLKYLAYITPEDEEDTSVQFAMRGAFQAARRRALELHDSDIETRVYCLHARNLQTSTMVGLTSSFYLSFDFPGDSKSDSTINDKANARTGTEELVFNKCYRFTVSLPKMAVLRIRVMQVGALQDAEVGCIFVNLENLWWLQEYREMVASQTLPIETRTLRLFSGDVNVVTDIVDAVVTHIGGQAAYGAPNTATGELTLWVDMMTAKAAQARPIAVLASAEPQPYQLRVVVWRLRKCRMGTASSVSLLVSGSFRHHDDSLETQWTDTHFNSRDGTGIYNWRFVYDILIPARFTTLTFNVHHYSLVGTGDLLGSAAVDMQKDFSVAQRTRNGVHSIATHWLSLTNPREPGLSQGELELEISVVTRKIANLMPVGRCREEPNRDPFLQLVTDNRTYVDWEGWNDTLKDLSSSISWTTKWLFWIALALVLIASTVSLVVLLK